MDKGEEIALHFFFEDIIQSITIVFRLKVRRTRADTALVSNAHSIYIASLL